MKLVFSFASLSLLLCISFCFASCDNSSSKTGSDSLTVKVKRGDYLVNAVANCMHCHADRDFTKFSGPSVPGTEGKGGQRKGAAFASNITPTVLANWTDEEIERAITTGINKAGDTLFFTMPYVNFKYLTKYDAESIVAYLRTLKPLVDSVPKRNLDKFPPGILSSLYHEYYRNDFYQTLTQPNDEELQKGKYLVTIGGCMTCHTILDVKSLTYKRDSVFAGGLPLSLPASNFKVYSANITPDTITGIGAWSEEMFLAKFKSYRVKEAYNYDPGKNNSAMPWTIFANMTDDDLKRIYRYLRTINPIKHQVTKWPQ